MVERVSVEAEEGIDPVLRARGRLDRNEFISDGSRKHRLASRGRSGPVPVRGSQV